MRKIFLFMHVSLDGYFEGPGHDISWFNTDDYHFDQFPSGKVLLTCEPVERYR